MMSEGTGKQTIKEASREIEKNRTLYKVKHGEKMVGIFTAPDDMPGAEQYSIEEISVWHIEGTPVRGDDVYGAIGTRTLLINNGEPFSSELIEYEPAWGTNPQSALVGLLRGRSQVEVASWFALNLTKYGARGRREKIFCPLILLTVL